MPSRSLSCFILESEMIPILDRFRKRRKLTLVLSFHHNQMLRLIEPEQDIIFPEDEAFVHIFAGVIEKDQKRFLSSQNLSHLSYLEGWIGIDYERETGEELFMTIIGYKTEDGRRIELFNGLRRQLSHLLTSGAVSCTAVGACARPIPWIHYSPGAVLNYASGKKWKRHPNEPGCLKPQGEGGLDKREIMAKNQREQWSSTWPLGC